MNPTNHQALNYVRLLWPTTLCELIAVETNRYTFQRHVRDWTPTNADKFWAFLGTIVLMGYHTLPSFDKYWNSKKFNGVPTLQECMPKNPVKHGFKMYCLSCSCCGYLCDFLMYSGRYVDPVSGKTVKKVVK